MECCNSEGDDNADIISLVPVFLVKGRPVPAVYCPNVGGGEFLLGTHIIYTTAIKKVCVGRLLSHIIGSDEEVLVNVYNIVNESTTLDICKRGIKEVELTQNEETINTLNITDIAFVLNEDVFQNYPDLSLINNVYRNKQGWI